MKRTLRSMRKYEKAQKWRLLSDRVWRVHHWPDDENLPKPPHTTVGIWSRTASTSQAWCHEGLWVKTAKLTQACLILPDAYGVPEYPVAIKPWQWKTSIFPGTKSHMNGYNCGIFQPAGIDNQQVLCTAGSCCCLFGGCSSWAELTSLCSLKMVNGCANLHHFNCTMLKICTPICKAYG